MALAHPTVGLALIDLIPNATPNAEARLRRALETAGFPERCPGTLPVWHGRVDPMMLRTLPNVLAEGFDALPPLGLGGPEGWIGAVQAALARDPAWDVPGRPRVAPPASAVPDEAEEDEAPAPRRRWTRWAGRGAVLACCLAAGVALLPAAPTPTPSSPPPVAVAPSPEPTPVLAALPPPALAPVPEPPVAQSLPPIERVELPVLRSVEPPSAPVAEALAPPLPAVVEEEPALATPPPAPPPPPPLRQAAAPKPRIDPNCSRALFRFQQGERLTAAEEAFVRTGCATRR